MKNLNQIAITHFRKTIIFFVIVLLHFSSAYGQGTEEIEVLFESESIEVLKGSTFTNFLVFKNDGSTDITIQEIAPIEKYPGLLYFPKSSFTLASGQEKRFPVKFIANLDFLKMQSEKINFSITYSSLSDTKQVEATFNIVKEENKSIAIFPFSRENYIDPSTLQTPVLVFVESRGYSKRSIKLEFQSLPEGLDITPRQQILTLEGQEKRMVEIKVSTRKQNVLYPEYTIQVKATDMVDMEDAGSTNINLVVLTSNRQVSKGLESDNRINFAELTYNDNNSGLTYSQLRGKTEFAVTENLYTRFSLNSDYYTQYNLYSLYDTWFELEYKQSTLRIGNIYASDYDYSVSGRGAKATTKIGENSEIEVFALENNYALYSTYYKQTEGPKMAGAKYNFGTANTFNGKVSYIFNHDPRQAVNSQVTDFISSFTLNNLHNFRVETGLSYEKGLVKNDQNFGTSLGLNYESKIGSWNFQSLNSYASKAYAGLSRGSYFFNQRIAHELSDNKQVSLVYEISQVSPEYLSVQNLRRPNTNFYTYRRYFYASEALKIAYQFSTKNWNFLISPQVEQQKNQYTTSVQELLAYRLQSSIGTYFGVHGLNLNAEYSYSKDIKRADWFQSFKGTVAYSFKGISVNGTAQLNPVNVMDLSSYYYDNPNFVNYNLNTSYSFHAFKSALMGSVSAGINYSELYKNISNTFTGSLEYKISNTWSTTGYYNYSNYESTQENSYSGNNYQFRVGIKKYFPIATSKGKHKVSFVLFEDKNFNGILDDNESVLANEVVKLDKNVAITDKNGKVIFQNVMEGTYKVYVNESIGSRLMMDPMIAVYKNITKEVGLVKNNKVSGKLVELRQSYDVLETDATGIVVYAKNETGSIQTAVVNQNDEFEFFLQNGKYLIYIENDKYSFISPSQSITVDNTEYVENLVFEYKKKDTTIKVKKF